MRTKLCEVKMRRKFTNLATLGMMCLLLLASSAFGLRPGASAIEERRINDLISLWIRSYQALDAKQLAALETPDVETVDRFGVLRTPVGRNENEELWSDAFGTISPKSPQPAARINGIQLLRPDVALVQVSWQFSEGILLTDGFRIPAFSQLDTFVVIKAQGAWFVAAHNMQEIKS